MLTPSLTPDSNQPPLQLAGSSQSPTHMKCIIEKLLLVSEKTVKGQCRQIWVHLRLQLTEFATADVT